MKLITCVDYSILTFIHTFLKNGVSVCYITEKCHQNSHEYGAPCSTYLQKTLFKYNVATEAAFST